MKRTFILVAALAAAVTLQAQHPSHHEGKDKGHRPDITELVSDLSDKQKRSIDAITSESKERVSKLRSQQKAVSDSISMFMDRDGDQSKHLNPLFDRQARLHSLISREMYATKVRIDEILNPAQRQQLKQNSKRRGKKK